MNGGALLTADPDLPAPRSVWPPAAGLDQPGSRIETEVADALVGALGLRDKAMAEHSRRVGRMSSELGRQLCLPEPRRQLLEWSGLLHDVGKIAFPDRLVQQVLADEDDRAAIEAHPLRGARLVRRLPGALSEVADVVLQHHERLDGSGYPLGLAGSAISEDARIVAVADVFDAMTDPQRHWRKPSSEADALSELMGLAPKQFDQRAVDALASVTPRVYR